MNIFLDLIGVLHIIEENCFIVILNSIKIKNTEHWLYVYSQSSIFGRDFK